MSDEEYAYIWNVAETLGANHVTMELPTDDALLKRVADYAATRKLRIAFHTHGQGGASGFDKVLNASPYTALNFDVGHYYGVNGESPVPLVEKYHDRIASLHLKDRKGPTPGQPAAEGGRGGGPNMPWGQGETPLAAVLQSMKKNKYKFPASIEYEYQTPEGLRRAGRNQEVRGVLQEGAGVEPRGPNEPALEPEGEEAMASMARIMVIAVVLVCGVVQAQAAVVKNLQVEYRSTPLGIDVQQPRFSWQMEAHGRRARRRAGGLPDRSAGPEGRPRLGFEEDRQLRGAPHQVRRERAQGGHAGTRGR